MVCRWASREQRRNRGFALRIGCFQKKREESYRKGRWLPPRGPSPCLGHQRVISLGDGSVLAFHDGRRFWRYLCDSGDLFPGEECRLPASTASTRIGALFYDQCGYIRPLPLLPSDGTDEAPCVLFAPGMLPDSLTTIGDALVWWDCLGSLHAQHFGEHTSRNLYDLPGAPLLDLGVWILQACPLPPESPPPESDSSTCLFLRCSLAPRSASLQGAFHSAVERLCLRSEAYAYGSISVDSLAEAVACLDRAELSDDPSCFRGGIVVVRVTVGADFFECECLALLGRQCDERWLAEAASFPVWNSTRQRVAFVDRGGYLLSWNKQTHEISTVRVANPSRHDVLLFAFSTNEEEFLLACNTNLLGSAWRPASSAYFSHVVAGSWVTIPGGVPYVTCLSWDGDVRWQCALPDQAQHAVIGGPYVYVATLAGILLLRLVDGTLVECFPESCVSVSVYVRGGCHHVRLVLHDGSMRWLSLDHGSADRRFPETR